MGSISFATVNWHIVEAGFGTPFAWFMIFGWREVELTLKRPELARTRARVRRVLIGGCFVGGPVLTLFAILSLTCGRPPEPFWDWLGLLVGLAMAPAGAFLRHVGSLVELPLDDDGRCP